jgi:WXG100 family type VII secretion target
MTISLDHQLFHARTGAIAGRAADMADRRDEITTAVDALLVDWQGAAAGAFSEAWLSWRAAVDAVIASLATTADRLAATQADFGSTDGSQAIDHDRLAARLDR